MEVKRDPSNLSGGRRVPAWATRCHTLLVPPPRAGATSPLANVQAHAILAARRSLGVRPGTDRRVMRD
ncbi:hypothetical protein PC1_004 [Pseudomonas phage PC1]